MDKSFYTLFPLDTKHCIRMHFWFIAQCEINTHLDTEKSSLYFFFFFFVVVVFKVLCVASGSVIWRFDVSARGCFFNTVNCSFVLLLYK